MGAVRIGLVLALVLTASACNGGDDAGDAPATSTTSSAIPSVTETTEPTGTTEPVATTDVTTEPTTTTGPTTSTESPSTPSSTEPVATSAATTTTTTTTVEPSATTEPSVADVKVYYFRGERMEIAHREVSASTVLRGAITELLAGPTDDERVAGLSSLIPSATTLLDVSLADGQAIVDLSGEYESGGGTSSMLARLGQVVFTATQFDNVDRVLFWLDGGPVEFFGGEGIVLGEPQSRTNVPRYFTGGIIIDTPEPGATVRSPFVVTGEGDLFEGYAAMWVWRDGERIAGPFGVTAGAWGTWDDFETIVTLDIEPGAITLIVDDGNGCTPGDPECGEPNPAIADVTLVE